MGNNQKLENYLGKLNKALGQVAISEKAEIITELKCHVMEELERHPEQSIDSVLKSLGEPEQVANRYLLERGLKPLKAPKHPVVKWLVLGFLGSLALILAFSTFVLSQFSPLMVIDGEKGSVQFLGGLININDKGVEKNFGSEEKNKTISGNIETKEGDVLNLPFTNADLDVVASQSQQLSWNCEVLAEEAQGIDNFNVQKGANSIDIKLDDFSGIKCKLEVPKNISLNLDGNNGKIDLNAPEYDAAVKLSNGKVEFHPHSKESYVYDLKVVNGKIDSGFRSQHEESSKKIAISITNGKIDYKN